jgi:uncharacterized protein (TIGR00297 family)
VILRTAAGLALAAAIAAVARRQRTLDRSGAIAAIVVGTVAVAAGWRWGVLLIAFFVTSTALSRLRAAAKARRLHTVVAKGGERDAVQVLANGGPFALAAALSLLTPWIGWSAAGVGALAAAAADTWGTEIGTLAARPPRLITTGRPVPVGTSGGVTLPGLLATLAGALFAALLVWLLGWPPVVAGAALAGGVAGALADSLLGALCQVRRWCGPCGTATERTIHPCGAVTTRVGGVSWMDNDIVNVLSGIAGAAVALLVAH